MPRGGRLSKAIRLDTRVDDRISSPRGRERWGRVIIEVIEGIILLVVGIII